MTDEEICRWFVEQVSQLNQCLARMHREGICATDLRVMEVNNIGEPPMAHILFDGLTKAIVLEHREREAS